MRNKFTLTGTDNDGFRHRYSIKKNEGFKEAFIDFMMTMDFDPDRFKRIFITRYENEKGEEVERELKIKEIGDECWHFQNKKFDVDIFFGIFKIIIVVRAKDRVPIVDHLENRADWIKTLKIKKIKDDKMKNKMPVIIKQVKNRK